MQDNDPYVPLEVPINPISKEKIWEWSLVLSSVFIEHKVLSQGIQLNIYVRDKDFKRAVLEILEYERENRTVETGNKFVVPRHNMEASLWILFCLFIFHLITVNSRFPFLDLGCADSWAIYKGEWWRLITALTLHENIPHVISNIFWEGIFIYFLLIYIPPAMAWFLILLSGILGNLLNFYYHSLNHISLGFSTCVFGTLGIGIGFRSLSQVKDIGLYIMCGLGLLAMLGMGTKGIDVSSHVFGLLCGFLIGIFNRVIIPKKLRNRSFCFWCICFLIVFISWLMAGIYGHDYITTQ